MIILLDSSPVFPSLLRAQEERKYRRSLRYGEQVRSKLTTGESNSWLDSWGNSFFSTSSYYPSIAKFVILQEFPHVVMSVTDQIFFPPLRWLLTTLSVYFYIGILNIISISDIYALCYLEVLIMCFYLLCHNSCN